MRAGAVASEGAEALSASTTIQARVAGTFIDVHLARVACRGWQCLRRNKNFFLKGCIFFTIFSRALYWTNKFTCISKRAGTGEGVSSLGTGGAIPTGVIGTGVSRHHYCPASTSADHAPVGTYTVAIVSRGTRTLEKGRRHLCEGKSKRPHDLRKEDTTVHIIHIFFSFNKY